MFYTLTNLHPLSQLLLTVPFLLFADCLDLILSMLDKDRSRRLTPGQVLDHSWFGDVADVIDLREFVVSRCSSIDDSPWANPEKTLRKGSLVPRAGTKVSLHKCED